MKINEKYKNCSIHFYKNDDGSVEYTCPFANGKGKSLEDALNKFGERDWQFDLFLYYNDVQDIKFGSFEPALKDKKKNGKLYLGKINLKLDLNDYYDEHTIKYLIDHPEAIKKHDKYIDDFKKAKIRAEIVQNLKDGFTNIKRKMAGILNPQYEMFFPEKTRQDLICTHCGEIIPNATYYDEYEGKPYHLECIWDRFYSRNKSRDYEECQKFFMDLKRFIGRWPANGLDVEQDYIDDLNLVEHNKRISR